MRDERRHRGSQGWRRRCDGLVVVSAAFVVLGVTGFVVSLILVEDEHGVNLGACLGLAAALSAAFAGGLALLANDGVPSSLAVACRVVAGAALLFACFMVMALMSGSVRW